MADIKELLNDIISGGNNATTTVVVPTENNATFDPESYKEKLAFGVLKDMTHAMMHDEKLSDDSMVDKSIMDHIHNDYKGTCFGYLSDARDRLKSPLLNDIIQEIEEAAIMEEADFKEKGYVRDNHKISSDILKDNPDYKTFRAKLTEETSNMVINDMANEILRSRGTPTFDNLDEKIKPVAEDPNKDTVDDTGMGPSASTDESFENSAADEDTSTEATFSEEEQELPTAPTEDMADTTPDTSFEDKGVTESAILRMTETIVTESYMNGNTPLTTEQGMEKAICEYCVQQLCFLFKDTSRSPFDKLLK